jgi:tetratricopeptide (TPR) repeat protein
MTHSGGGWGRAGRMIRDHARVIGIAIFLVTPRLGSGVAGVATPEAWAEPAADVATRCGLLHGRPAVDACDDAMRSRRPGAARAEAAHEKGVELGKFRRDEDAVAAYRASIRVRPDYAAAYTNLGFALSRLGRWDEARRAYERAVRLAPDDVDARYDLGVALATLDRPEDALREFRQVLRRAPTDADAHYNVGRTLNDLGRHVEAAQAYREAVRARPGYADAWGNLGLSAILIGQYGEAREAFERARALVPTYFDSRPIQRYAWEFVSDLVRIPDSR